MRLEGGGGTHLLIIGALRCHEIMWLGGTYLPNRWVLKFHEVIRGGVVTHLVIYQIEGL